ncbi:MAG TPA: 4-alpha-glucanotransferase [Candidatus Limnocylindria bacterium]
MSASPIEERWVDAWRRPRTTPPAVRDAVLGSMSLEQGELARAAAAVHVTTPGAALPLPGELELEDGSHLGEVRRVPRDTPFGYHRLRRPDAEQLLLVAPQRCPLPADLRDWGWAVQLYATRSRRSWGMGDLADLRRLAAWSRDLGAGALLLSPLAAANPAPVPEPSPYYPSSRRFRSPLYLAVEEVPGFGELGTELAPLVESARRLSEAPVIDRAAVQRAKLEALQRIWAQRRGTPDAEQEGFKAIGGEPLQQWGLFAALSERHGPGWRQWPARLRDPAGAGVRRAATELADRVAFHVWLQYLVDRQLAAAGQGLRLISDLPLGFDPGGFDAWCWQSLLASASLGAPPDRFNPVGQAWGLPPFVPARLQLAGHAPFAETIRAALRPGGGVRIDHILGIFRQWWIPEGAAPGDGAYVRQPTDELLAVLAIESQRAGAIVIGEDLGTVPAGVRPRLAAANVLSTRLAYFEQRPPARWPRSSVAAVTTHDLPTLAGTWTGADAADQAAAGLHPDARALAGLRRRLARIGSISEDALPEQALLAVYRAVARAPSVLALAALEDATLDPRRPNLPGTSRQQRDNWSHALPMTVEELAEEDLPRRLAAAMARD